MSRRARKRARMAAVPSRTEASRSELKNAEARARLEPLAQGERPGAVTAAAAVAALLVVANAVLALAGFEIDGKRPAIGGVVVFTLLLGVMTWGLWTARYWAVLGMQALLGITILLFALKLPFASDVQTALLSLAVLIPAATLFWFLVKAMARIQMPERR
jgi:hypothetical protein